MSAVGIRMEQRSPGAHPLPTCSPPCRGHGEESPAQGEPSRVSGRRPMLDDQQLVAELLGSNRGNALAECVRRYGPMVKRSAWRITGDEHLAEDVCQAVFFVLLRKAASLTNVKMLGAWLYRVA